MTTTQNDLERLLSEHEYMNGACLCRNFKLPPYGKKELDEWNAVRGDWMRDIRWKYWLQHVLDSALGVTEPPLPPTAEQIAASRDRLDPIPEPSLGALAEQIRALQEALKHVIGSLAARSAADSLRWKQEDARHKALLEAIQLGQKGPQHEEDCQTRYCDCKLAGLVPVRRRGATFTRAKPQPSGKRAKGRR